MKTKSAFTLIELLVVIAVIGLLLAIVLPRMKKAMEYARKVVCRSNLRQIASAMSTYEIEAEYNFRNIKSWSQLSSSQRDKHWFWRSGTADLAHEEQPHAIRFLMKENVLPNREIFFCPGVKNLSYDMNYEFSAVSGGNLEPRNTDDIYREDKLPMFWSTYVWIWKKELRSNEPQVVSVNNVSSGAMMLDMTNGLWEYARQTNTTLMTLMNDRDIQRAFSHGNVLMQDFSVANPSDDDDELNVWLWGKPYWAGNIGFDF